MRQEGSKTGRKDGRRKGRTTEKATDYCDNYTVYTVCRYVDIHIYYISNLALLSQK